jgi:hypothetical protein
METVRFSETLGSSDKYTRHQNHEEHHHPHGRENFTPHIVDPYWEETLHRVRLLESLRIKVKLLRFPVLHTEV